MAAPIPPTLDELGERPFSFYPPIVNIEHNEWTYKKGNWSEILVRNSKINSEVWIPRSYLGEISKIDEPVMIVGLRRELEYKGGSIWPYTRRVVSMPGKAVPDVPPGAEAFEPPPTNLRQSLRLNEGAEGGIGKMLMWVAIVGIVIVAGTAGYLNLRTTGGAVVYEGVLQADLGFTADTNYFDVVRKLGTPDRDHYRSETGERQYRLLVYPKQNLVIVLMGVERGKELYIGSKDLQGKVVHAVDMPGGKNTAAVLRSLGKLE
ncbi:MAG: hypothetical protein IT168_05285 [Bryobacterales bacterium]|nr:hypothetical protein [Bryobacterales bacterium]